MSPFSIFTIIAAGILAGLFGFLFGTGLIIGEVATILVLWVVIAYLLGKRASTPDDPWLPGLMSLAMIAKLIGSWGRYYLLLNVYHGSGDAGRYHRFGLEIAETWRAFQVPDLATVGFGSQGTRFTAWVTGLLYTPYEPSLLGGFWIYALLAFLGQFFLYLAFRRAAGSSGWKRYAILVFFWPTLVYWPSSLGKEALIMLFLGVGSWAAANLYRRYHVRWLPFVVGSALLISMVRAHVAALFVGSLLAGVFVARRPRGVDAMLGWFLILLIGIASLAPLAARVSDQFGVNLDSSLTVDDLEPVFSKVGDTTHQGGSAVSGGVIRSPVDIPAGLVKVLFSPLPHHSSNAQMLASSVEGVMLLGLIIWRLPKMVGNWRLLRRSPYLTFCIVYSAGFVWAWSAILNLGILARQRALVIPFILALVTILGWGDNEDATESSTPTKDQGLPANDQPIPTTSRPSLPHDPRRG